MECSALLASAEEILRPWAGVVTHPSEERVDVTIPDRSLKAAVKALVDAQWGYLAAITGLDHPGTAQPASEDVRWQRLSEEGETAPGDEQREGTLEVLYHFCNGPCVLTIRVSNIRYTFPVLNSICGVIPMATLYEREVSEMFGIKIVATPVVDRLLLSDDWPDGVFPMRKSFTGLAEPPQNKNGGAA